MRYFHSILAFFTVVLWAMGGANQPTRTLSVRDEPVDSLKLEIMAIADTSDVPSKFRIAMLLETGRGPLMADSAAALKYITEAADSSYAPALNYLGFKYLRGEGVSIDSVKGISLLRRAADMGDARSFNNLGWLYLQGHGVKRDYQEAARWFERALEAGVPTAAATLGDMYRDGLGMATDSLKADSLYTVAIARGLSDAQLRLIDLHKDDWKRLPADSALRLGLNFYPAPGPAVGIVLFEQAADAGNAQAMALLGDAFSRGIGVRYDHGRAINYYYRAAAGGNPSAQFVIAELLDMFPDALADIETDIELNTDPQYWYSQAQMSGITNAEKASECLLQLPPDSIH